MKHLPSGEAAYGHIGRAVGFILEAKWSADTEGFVNYPLSIDGINISALILEKEDLIKFSFRSRGNFPANEFSAAWFNGGGHKMQLPEANLSVLWMKQFMLLKLVWLSFI